MTSARTRIGAACALLALIGLAAFPAVLSAACGSNPEVAGTPPQPTDTPPSDSALTRTTPAPTSTPTFAPTAFVQTKPTVSPEITPTPEPADPKTVEEKWREWGVRIGDARVAGGEEILATIYGRPFTVGEFEERKERLLVSIERFRHELSRDVPAHDLSPYDEARRVAVKRLLSAIEKYDIEAMVLCSFLIELTRYDLAIGLGQLSPSDTKLAMEINKHLVAFEEQYNPWPSDGPLWALIEGYIEAVGSERYWSEILPTVLERNLAIGSWTWPAASLEKARGKAKRKRDAELGAVHASSSALKGLNVLDFSSTKPEQIQSYAEERWDIFEAGLADLETLPGRPEKFPYVMPLLTHGLLSPLIETLDKSTFAAIDVDSFPENVLRLEPRIGTELSEEDMATFCPPEETPSSFHRLIREKVYHHVDGEFKFIGEGITDILFDPAGNTHWLFKDANDEVIDEQIFVERTQYIKIGEEWAAVPNPMGPIPRRSANINRPGHICAFSVNRLAEILDHGMETLDGVLLRHVSAIDLTPAFEEEGQRTFFDFWFDSEGRAVHFKVTDYVPARDWYPVLPDTRTEIVTTYSRPEGPVSITAPDVSVDAK